MKKRGQALVEFIIILPIFLIIFLAVLDISKISLSKISLENRLSEIIESYEDGQNLDTIKKKLQKENITLQINQDEYLTFSLTKNITIVTPGLNLIFKNPYQLSTYRSVKNA